MNLASEWNVSIKKFAITEKWNRQILGLWLELTVKVCYFTYKIWLSASLVLGTILDFGLKR